MFTYLLCSAGGSLLTCQRESERIHIHKSKLTEVEIYIFIYLYLELSNKLDITNKYIDGDKTIYQYITYYYMNTGAAELRYFQKQIKISQFWLCVPLTL